MSIFLTSFSSFSQTISEAPLIDIRSSYHGCCFPAVQVAPSSCCATIIRKEDQSEASLKITDPELDGPTVSPNPTKGELTITVPPALVGHEIRIIDMTGRIVGNPVPIRGAVENIFLEGKPGIYLLTIRTEKQVITERILLDK